MGTVQTWEVHLPGAGDSTCLFTITHQAFLDYSDIIRLSRAC